MTFARSQKRAFVRDGYLALPEVFEDEDDLVEQARDAVLAGMDQADADETAYQGDAYEHVTEVGSTEPFTALKHRLYEYASELVGDALAEPPETVTLPEDLQIKIKHPEQVRLGDLHRRQATDGHIDGYGYLFRVPDTDTSGEYTYTTVGAVVYLSQVEAGGGGFTVYPGSHWVAADYYRDHSLESPGHTGALPAIDDDGGWDYGTPLRDQLRSREVTGPSGTVVFYHSKLLHGVGINQRSTPRIAAITRFTHERGEAIKRDAARNIWKYWNGLETVSTDPAEYTVLDDTNEQAQSHE